MTPPTRARAVFVDENSNGLLDKAEWVNIGRMTYQDDQHRHLDLDVCESAQDYFRAGRDPGVSPSERWRRMTAINPRLRLSGEMRDYLRSEQREWLRQHPPRKEQGKGVPNA